MSLVYRTRYTEPRIRNHALENMVRVAKIKKYRIKSKFRLKVTNLV